MKKLYYDALFTGLVEVTNPVSVPDRPWKVEVTVAKTCKAYKAGDKLTVWRRDIVHKAGVRDGFIMVKTAKLG